MPQPETRQPWLRCYGDGSLSRHCGAPGSNAALARRGNLPGWQQTAEAVLGYLERPQQPSSTPTGSPPALPPMTSARAATVSTLLPELINYLIEAAGPRRHRCRSLILVPEPVPTSAGWHRGCRFGSAGCILITTQ